MLNLLRIAYYIVGIAAIIIALVIVYKRSKPKGICDGCEHLVSKGGSLWKYACRPPGSLWEEHNDKPKEYCKYYQKREDPLYGEPIQ